MGIPKEAVKLYLLTLANSNFEEWYLANPGVSTDEFKMTFEKMGGSGALFDTEKLNNIAKTFLSTVSAKELYERIYAWAKIYDEDFAKVMEANKEKTIATLNIERETEKPRKDFAMYSEIKDLIWYMFDELYQPTSYEWGKITEKEEIKNILDTYIEKYYDENDNQEDWFNKVKLLCDNLGYASNMKEYKKNPEAFKGNVADVSTVIRVAVTSKSRTPNLYDILQILGIEEIKKRIEHI